MPLRAAILLVLSLSTLAACSGTPEEFVTPNAEIGAADVQRIYLATDRVLAEDLTGTTVRAGALSFAQYDITIPPGHAAGEVEFSARNPDPDTSFTVAGARGHSSITEFGRIVRAEAGPLGRPIDSTVVYVHGFNTAMEYAVYRHEPDRVYRRGLSWSLSGDVRRELCVVEVPFCCCG